MSRPSVLFPSTFFSLLVVSLFGASVVVLPELPVLELVLLVVVLMPAEAAGVPLIEVVEVDIKPFTPTNPSTLLLEV
jgi:hypothetical protein